MKADKYTVSAYRDSPVWAEARKDARAAFLPWVAREMVEGTVDTATMTSTEWGKLQTFLSSLPSGKTSLAVAVADPPAEVIPERSARAIAAERVAELVRLCGANVPFGGEVARHFTGKYYCVTFALGRLMSGVVYVYSAEYVRVSYTSQTPSLPPDGLPPQETRVFGSVEDAMRFLSMCLHAGKYREALAIPVRPKRGESNH